MGLRKAGHLSSLAGQYGLPGLIALLAVLGQAGGETVRDALQYDRHAIVDGEYYRLLTGHLVHLGWPHLLLNLAGLALIWLLVGDRYNRLQWLAVLAGTAVLIDAAFWYFLPELRWYVGLSGVLHGLLVAGAIVLLSVRRVEGIILLSAVSAKLVYEYLLGPMPGSTSSVGGNVVTEAHLYGAIGGAIMGTLIMVTTRRIGARA